MDDEPNGSAGTHSRGRRLVVTRETTATPEQVWAVLCDGWAYAGWVVGASRIREVDPTWPEAGAKIQHSVGSWPVLLDDETESVSSEPERELVLQARGRPFGEARISLEISPRFDGCEIRMLEDVTHGPGTFVPKPLRQVAVTPRNRESLRRLAYLAERGAASR